jgi:hypothetical protein
MELRCSSAFKIPSEARDPYTLKCLSDAIEEAGLPFPKVVRETNAQGPAKILDHAITTRESLSFVFALCNHI